MRGLSLLTGPKVLEEIISPINGKLTVMRDLAWGTYIKGGGLTQSGGVAELVWKESLKKVKSKNVNISNCLILGLGGGGISKLIRKNWPKSKITGIDIDPIIVELGKKYLGLKETGTKIILQDAFEYCAKYNTNNIKFDLICVDIYVKDEYPKKFEEGKFFSYFKKMIEKDGIIVFNRLYYDKKRKEATKFGKALEKEFPKVETVYPQANVMFICGY